MASSHCRPPRHALVLAAGLGTRLHPLTRVRAKPAIPVAGVPIVRRIIDWLVRAGVDRLVVNLHHRPDTLTAVVGDGSDLGAQVRYSWEPVVLGTAGGPRQALALLEADTFLIVNGDTLTDVDLSAPCRRACGHARPRHARARAARRARPVRRRATRRPGRGDRLRAARSRRGGLSSLRRRANRAGRRVSRSAGRRSGASVGGVYDALLARGDGAVRGFVSDARFFDVGTPEDYWNTSLALAGDGFPPRAGARTSPARHTSPSRFSGTMSPWSTGAGWISASSPTASASRRTPRIAGPSSDETTGRAPTRRSESKTACSRLRSPSNRASRAPTDEGRTRSRRRRGAPRRSVSG